MKRIYFYGELKINSSGEPIFEIMNSRAMAALVYAQFGVCRFKMAFTLDDKGKDSADQRYYWGVLLTLIHKCMREHGNDWTKQDVHDQLKALWPGMPKDNGIPTTKLLGKREFKEYIQWVERFAAEFLRIEFPDKATFEGKIPTHERGSDTTTHSND